MTVLNSFIRTSFGLIVEYYTIELSTFIRVKVTALTKIVHDHWSMVGNCYSE